MSNMKTKEKCPMRCPELKIKRADVNSRKLLNKIILKCLNYPDCDFTASYWDLFSHEENKTFIIKNCSYCGNSQDLRRCLCNDVICLNWLEEIKTTST